MLIIEDMPSKSVVGIQNQFESFGPNKYLVNINLGIYKQFRGVKEHYY